MIKKALGGEIELSIDSIVTIQIDDLVLYDLRYKRNNLTATVNKGFWRLRDNSCGMNEEKKRKKIPL